MNCGNGALMTWLGSIFGYVVQLFYELFHNYGVAIILFTIVTRILMFPLSIKQQKTSAAQARLQPKLNELQKRYGNDKMAYNTAMQELYQKEGVSPTAGCLPLLIQFPLFIGMYQAISRPLTCVLHLGKDKISALLEALGIAANNRGYYEVDAIVKLRDILNGAGGAAVSGSDVVSGSAVASLTDVISNTNVASIADVVSNSSVSATDIAAGVDYGTIASILGDSTSKVHEMCNSFNFLGFDLLQTAGFWNKAVIIAFLVFIAQVGSMMISNKISKMPDTQGCNPNLMAVGMGAFSLFIAFSVPAAFPLYWLTSSVLTPVQTWVTREYFGPVVMNAKAEAQRNARRKLEEQAIIDEVEARKGKLTLEPMMPEEKKPQENIGIQRGAGYGSGKSSKKKKGNNGGNNNNSSDYMGRKK